MNDPLNLLRIFDEDDRKWREDYLRKQVAAGLKAKNPWVHAGAMIATLPDDGSFTRATDFVYSATEAEVELNLWRRIETTAQALSDPEHKHHTETPYLLATVWVIREEQQASARDTYSGRGNDVRRVRADAIHEWIRKASYAAYIF